jgi:hypothetical protein
MGYDPQNDMLDFEIGSFGSVFRKAKRGLGKVTQATITKPSMMIGKAIGGKRGEAIGKKLGGFTSKVTTLGVGAGAAGVAAGLAPALAPIGVPVATALAAKKLLGRKGGHPIASGVKRLLGPKPKSRVRTRVIRKRCTNDKTLAAQVGAMLVAKLGGPIHEANKALKMAELQREATYEHRKLMSDANFRKAVLGGITKLAAGGNTECQRTIKVLVGR